MSFRPNNPTHRYLYLSMAVGGVAPALAGHLANTYGIASVLTLAMGGLALGCVIGVFLKETAPRKQRVAPAATNPV